MLHNVEPFDAPDGMLHHNAALAHILVEPFLHLRQAPVPGLFERHDDIDVFRFMALKATILLQPHARRIPAALFVGDFLIVHRTEVGCAQEDNVLVILAVDLVLVGMAFFLPLYMASWAASSTALGMACSTTSWLRVPTCPKRSRKSASPLPSRQGIVPGRATPCSSRGVNRPTHMLAFPWDRPKVAAWNCCSGCCLQ